MTDNTGNTPDHTDVSGNPDGADVVLSAREKRRRELAEIHRETLMETCPWLEDDEIDERVNKTVSEQLALEDFEDFEDLDGETTAPEAPSETEADKIAQLQQALAEALREKTQLEAKVTEYRDSASRDAQRLERDRELAIEKFARDLLQVADTMEMGLNTIPQADREADARLDKLARGFQLTLGKLEAVFNKHGVRAINPDKGADFDPNLHEAVNVADAPDAEPETVVAVKMRGYEFKGKVLRPAKVVITPP